MPAMRKLQKLLTIVQGSVSEPSRMAAWTNRAYDELVLAGSPVPTLGALDYLGPDVSINLRGFLSVDGNVTLDELVFICALARKKDPRRLVEIGTFDGNTALQMALNTSSEAKIATLDLPVGSEGVQEVDLHDLKYITSERRIERRFLNTDVSHKVHQHYGNSLTYDFASFFPAERPDFIFIDAGHSYQCVKSDSEKALAVLDDGGTIVWQDYSTGWPGVYQYLVELSAQLKLVHIAGTSLVIYTSDRRAALGV